MGHLTGTSAACVCSACCPPASSRNHGGILSLTRILIVALMLAGGACKPPPKDPHPMPGADARAGLRTIERVGCGACHAIPGLHWPRGGVGPDLHGLSRQSLIAGRLPNRPEVLAAYVRNAPALVPGSAMPAMPVTGDEARDIAAYLLSPDR